MNGKLVLICLTVLLIALAHEWTELMREQTRALAKMKAAMFRSYAHERGCAPKKEQPSAETPALKGGWEDL